MFAKVVLVCMMVGVALADRRQSYRVPEPSYQPPQQSYQPPQPSYRPRPSYREPERGPAQYDFTWTVEDEHSGNHYGQQENRNGYDTEGSYYVALPDGRLQRVSYLVNGDSGYITQVEYEGEARYPEQRQSYRQPRPSYEPPRPSYEPPRPSYEPPRPQYG